MSRISFFASYISLHYKIITEKSIQTVRLSFLKLTLISLTTLQYFDNEMIGSTNISNTNAIVLFYSEANVNKRMNN